MRSEEEVRRDVLRAVDAGKRAEEKAEEKQRKDEGLPEAVSRLLADRLHWRQGYALTEIILGMVVFVSIAVLAYEFYQSAKDDTYAQQTERAIMESMNTIDAAFAGRAYTLNDIDAQGLVTMGFWPAEWLRSDGLMDPWRGTVTIESTGVNYSISLSEIPGPACVRLATMCDGCASVHVNDTPFALAEGQVPVSASSAAGACSEGRHNVVVIEGRASSSGLIASADDGSSSPASADDGSSSSASTSTGTDGASNAGTGAGADDGGSADAGDEPPIDPASLFGDGGAGSGSGSDQEPTTVADGGGGGSTGCSHVPCSAIMSNANSSSGRRPSNDGDFMGGIGSLPGLDGLDDGGSTSGSTAGAGGAIRNPNSVTGWCCP